MIKPGDRIDFSGVFDEEGIMLKRTDAEAEGEYKYSIQLSFNCERGPLDGAVDISTSGDILGIELLGLDRIIERLKCQHDKGNKEL